MQEEKRERSSLRRSIRNQLPSNAAGLVHSSPVDNLLTRVDRRQNKQTRDDLEQMLLATLKKIRSDIRGSVFDIPTLPATLNGNDRSAVREYAAEFIWHLRQKGWRQEDIEQIPDDLRQTNASLSSYLTHCAIRQERDYTGIIFIPGLDIEVSPQTILASKTTLYPAGKLSANVTSHLPFMSQEFKVELSYYLHHCDAVGFEVTAFTKDHADKKIINKATAFIGELSHIEPKQTLTLPQFHNTFRRFIWENNTNNLSMRTNFSHNTYTVNERILEPLIKFHQASYASGMPPIVERLSNATRFFHRANSPGPQTDEVVNSIIAIEAAVSGGYSKQNEIIETAMNIVGVYTSRRSRIKRIYERLYHVRNEIVHSGNADSVSTDEIDSVLSTVRHQLRFLIHTMSHSIAEYGVTTLEDLERSVQHKRSDQFAKNAIQLYQDGISVGTPHRFKGKILDVHGTPVFETNGVLYIEPDYPSMKFWVTLRDIQLISGPVYGNEELELRATIAGNNIRIGNMNSISLLMEKPVEYIRDGYT